MLSNLVDFFFFRKPEIGTQSHKEKLYHVGIHSCAGVLCSFTIWLKVVSEEVVSVMLALSPS